MYYFIYFTNSEVVPISEIREFPSAMQGIKRKIAVTHTSTQTHIN